MILLCAGERSDRSFDALLVFAIQLDQAGHSVGIDARFLPDDAPRYQKFEAALYLCDSDDVSPDNILLIGADNITDDVQLILRTLSTGNDIGVFGIGRFATHQMFLNAQNKLAYALGREAVVFNLGEWQGETALIEESAAPLLTTITPDPIASRKPRAGLLIYLPVENLEIATVLPELAALSHAAEFDLHIVTNGRGKELIRRSRYAHLSVFGNSDLPPAALLSYADILAFFGPNIPGARMAQFAMNAMGSGNVVIDCTDDGCFMNTGAPALQGPTDLLSLATYLDNVVLPHRTEIGRRIQSSPWLEKFDLARLEKLLGLTRPTAAPAPKSVSTVFFPTNAASIAYP
jgi:hypothetical protein